MDRPIRVDEEEKEEKKQDEPITLEVQDGFIGPSADFNQGE